MAEKHLKLADIKAFKISSALSDSIWKAVANWGNFEKNTIGSQLTRAIDSIGANIAEGFGRYHKKDKQKFFYNARGSVFECSYWIQKCFERQLITNTFYEDWMKQLRTLPREINWLIYQTEVKLKK